MARKKTDSTPAAKPKTKKPATKTSTKERANKKTQSRFSAAVYFQTIRQNIIDHRNLYLRYLVIVLLVVALGAFLVIKKNWFVAAVVNNQPITTLEYYQNLKAKDTKQVLNQIVRDKLISQEANKNGIIVSNEEMDKKISEIEEQLGGNEGLNQALESRAITEEEFRNQIRIQLIVERLLADQIKVSDQEVEEYIAQNKDKNTLGVDLNDKDAVKKQLENEKLNEKFQPWYDTLQKEAKIYIFI